MYKGKHEPSVFQSLDYFFKVIISGSTHFPMNVISFFSLQKGKIPVCLYHSIFIPSFIDGHLGSSIAAIVNRMTC